jgi:hypothetical protein
MNNFIDAVSALAKFIEAADRENINETETDPQAREEKEND